MAVFDPMRLTGLPTRLAWSPVRGCETPRTAFVRARGLAAGTGLANGLTDGDFWSGQTETVLRACCTPPPWATTAHPRPVPVVAGPRER